MKLILVFISLVFCFACSNVQIQKQERLPSSDEQSDASKVKFPEARRVNVAIIDSWAGPDAGRLPYLVPLDGKIAEVSTGPLIGKNIFEVFGKNQSDFNTKESFEIIDKNQVSVSFMNEVGFMSPSAIIRAQEEVYNLFYIELNADFTIKKIKRIHGSDFVVSKALQLLDKYPAAKEMMKEFKIPETLE